MKVSRGATDKIMITTTITETIKIQHGQITIITNIKDGKCSGSLGLKFKGPFFGPMLFFKDLQDLRNIALAVQESLKAIAERIDNA